MAKTDVRQLYHRFNLIEVALADDLGVTHFISQVSTYEQHEGHYRREGFLL